MATEPQTLGLAGVAQAVRLRRHVQHVRKGQVCKQTDEVVFAVTTFLAEEASPARLLAVAREHWSIENGQFHRRDRTQREDGCVQRDPAAARNLSLFRSLAIFLFQQQSARPHGKKSLPDFQHQVHRRPGSLIRRLTQPRREA